MSNCVASLLGSGVWPLSVRLATDLRQETDLRNTRLPFALYLFLLSSIACAAQGATEKPMVHFDRRETVEEFGLVEQGHAAAIYVAPGNPETVRVAAEAFSSDIERVTGIRPQVLSSMQARRSQDLIIVGVVGISPEIDAMRREGRLQTAGIEGRWESAVTGVVQHPLAGVRRALVIAGSDRRGASFALFTLSRQMGVSPWVWWADVPVPHHSAVYVRATSQIQGTPSIQYRGIFLNDEDWGLRPWAAKKMDPAISNIGSHTYERVFELLLRLHANTLWPAMHPGSLAFNALPENARLADRWGIVMSSSHSEALLRNNVGEWNEKRDGPWNYQTNRAAIDAYWDKRLVENGGYENFYTVGMRGVHDSGLEATGSIEVKARLVEDVMAAQRSMIGKHVTPDVQKVPQVLWLYKESLDLYRAGMRVPDDVTLGWTDDNYGYIRQLPTVDEQRRAGGSGVYYHVSYWGSPHDYLWLCSTPPALIQAEMTKAYDHGARRYWVLNVGDLKPAEMDIDYFMQLAWDEPGMSQVSQSTFLMQWSAEQFPASAAPAIADVMERYYQLNFVRKPEFMGFNGYNDGINRTEFNPLAWGDQNRARLVAWSRLRADEMAIAKTMPQKYRDAFFELVAYPVEAATAQNEKFLFTDRSYLDASPGENGARQLDTAAAQAAYGRIQSLTAQYNSLAEGKWDGMMSAAPRNREVFKMPKTAVLDGAHPLPASWGVEQARAPVRNRTGFFEKSATISINAAHFARKQDGQQAEWRVLPELGVSGESVVYGSPGLLANAMAKQSKAEDGPWLEYDFETITSGDATLTLHLLPTFPVDSQHSLRFAVALDGHTPVELDANGAGERHENSASAWAANVLRNDAALKAQLGELQPGRHTLRLIYEDPGVTFEHIVIAFATAPPAYPVPPETTTIDHQ